MLFSQAEENEEFVLEELDVLLNEEVSTSIWLRFLCIFLSFSHFLQSGDFLAFPGISHSCI